MTRTIDRRHFLEQSARVAAGVGLTSLGRLETLVPASKPWFQISLAGWSFHKALFAGTMDQPRLRQGRQERAADRLRRLAEFGAQRGIAVIVENHGGLSSNGQWLVGVMKKVNLGTCGTLPDFGNFELGDGQEYDRYKGVAEMIPFAKAVSAKSYDFDDAGNETRIDYPRMLKIVKDAGYRSFLGIEYEGNKHSEPEGVRLTKV